MSDFETIYEFLAIHIKIIYVCGNDITETLRVMELPDTDKLKPIIQTSTKTDANEKKREEHQFKLDYKTEYNEYMKHERTLEENGYKTHAEIWALCNKAMQGKIEFRKDYEREIYDKPIKLIEEIKDHTLNF